MNPPLTLFGQEAHRVQQRQVDVAADYRDVVCNRVLSGGGGRDRPFGGFDGAVRPQLASLRLAMSLKPQIAMHRSSSARNECRKWVRRSAPP